MAALGKSANVRVLLAGQEIFPPVDWFDISVKASFENGNVQANVTSEQLEFIFDAYTKIKDHVANGMNGGVGIFEGIDLQIDASSTLGSINTFKGFVDLQDNMVIDDENGSVLANIKRYDGSNTLADQLEGLDYAYLVSKGAITPNDYIDVPYVVVKINASFESLVMAVMVYLLAKQTAEQIYLIANAIANFGGHAGGGGPFGPIGAAIFAVANAIIQIAYAAALLIAIIKLGRELLKAFFPPQRVHKAIYLRTLIEKACSFIGYGFETSVQDFENLVYLPSNPNYDEYDKTQGFLEKVRGTSEGIPFTTDYGYTLTEAFALCVQLFKGRFQLVNNVVQFHSENSDYWTKQADYVLPDVLQTPYRYNTEDLKSSYFIKFSTDVADGYTVENYKGTSYQVLTDAISVQDERRKTIKGSVTENAPVSLGNRKDDLTGFEQFLSTVANIFDKAASVFGGSSNYKARIENRVGVLKTETNNHTLPKLLWFEGGKIPQSHRDKFSAKTLWEKYHSYESFVTNPTRQRVLYDQVEIPFGFEDFTKVIDNSYFYTKDNKRGRITDLTWNMSKDFAIADYYIEEKYTDNLQETFIEP